MPDTVAFACPEPTNITAVALLMPCIRIEMSIRGERGDERIAMLQAARRKVGAACKVQCDQSEALVPPRARNSLRASFTALPMALPSETYLTFHDQSPNDAVQNTAALQPES